MKHIVAPNKLHYVYMEEWSQAYRMRNFGRQKDWRKIFDNSPYIQSYTILDKTIDISWLDKIDYLPFGEMPL